MIIRVLFTWVWYAAAVFAPVAVAFMTYQRRSNWIGNGQLNSGEAQLTFMGSLLAGFVLSALSNPLAVIVAPVTMIWFVALVAVQIFYFCTLVLYPNANF